MINSSRHAASALQAFGMLIEIHDRAQECRAGFGARQVFVDVLDK